MDAHNISVSMFVKEDEDQEALEAAFKLLFDFPLDKILNITVSEGLDGDQVVEYSVYLKKQSQIKKFLYNLTTSLTKEQKDTLISQTDSRLDSDYNFYMRFDKDALLENKLELTDSGKCVHVRINLATFPKNKENAVKLLNSIFCR